MIDKPENYYNFTHPNRWITPASFNHRLGKFQCAGIPSRIKPVKAIILHIPDWDRSENGIDKSAEQMASYLADPPERNIASIHIFADRDSFVLSMPSDTCVYGCANPNTAQESIEIEIAGTFKDHANPEYWHTEDAKLKLINTAKALYQLKILCNFDFPGLQVAKLNDFGNVIQPGFLQHRDVPIFRAGVWRQPLENIQFGQHADICAGFPYQILFDIITSEFEL